MVFDRRCSRRQSARFKYKESKATEDFFDIKDDKFSVSYLHDDSVDKSGETLLPLQDDSAIANGQNVSSLHGDPVDAIDQTLLELSVKKDEENAPLDSEAQECRRSSVGRPVRRAAEKVQSYKEFSIKAKMRRPE